MKTKASSTIVSFIFDGEEEFQLKYSKSKEDVEEMIKDKLSWCERSEYHTVKVISE